MRARRTSRRARRRSSAPAVPSAGPGVWRRPGPALRTKGEAVNRDGTSARTAEDAGGRHVPARVPWRRVAALLRPIRWGLAGMVGLSVTGVLVGLVPPLALGVLVDAL